MNAKLAYYANPAGNVFSLSPEDARLLGYKPCKPQKTYAPAVPVAASAVADMRAEIAALRRELAEVKARSGPPEDKEISGAARKG